MNINENSNSKKEPDKHPYDIADFVRKKVDELKQQRKYEDAFRLQDDFEKTRTGGPENYWVNMGLYIRQMGNFEESLKCFDKDIKINNNYHSHLEKGVTLYYMKNYDKAIQYLRKAYEIKYFNINDNSFLAENLILHKKPEDALTRSSRENKLKEHRLHYYLALTSYELKRYNESVEHLNKAVEIKSDDPDTLYGLAKSELMLNKPEKCLDLLEKSCTLDSSMERLLRIDPAFDLLLDNERFRRLCRY